MKLTVALGEREDFKKLNGNGLREEFDLAFSSLSQIVADFFDRTHVIEESGEVRCPHGKSMFYEIGED